MTEVVAAHDRVDILVNNAGITRYRPFLAMSDADWNLVLDVDLKGVFFCVQAAAPQMVPASLRQDHQHLFGSRHRHDAVQYCRLAGRQLGLRVCQGRGDSAYKDTRP
jgi:NAD(P)-dependent dehydrogenase (short-subunit alcohol dehydrogenase family)